MTWAEASGYNTAVDNMPTAQIPEITETGYPAYKGRTDITDPYTGLGPWRMPTPNEIHLIEMMEQALLSTAPSTGFSPLIFTNKMITFNIDVGYWTSAESASNAAWCLKEKYSEESPGIPKIRQRHMGATTKSSIALKQFVRCIQDLPLNP